MGSDARSKPVKLERLEAGMTIPWGGDRMTRVSEELAAAFAPGDRLIVVQESGALLRVPAAAAAQARAAVDKASAAFAALSEVSGAAIGEFFDRFAGLLETEGVWARIAAANAGDVARAAAAGRATGRLKVSQAMREDMAAGLRVWRDGPELRDRPLGRLDHTGWDVELTAAPLGVIGFVFEGRPNVFADAAGVIRAGSTAVFRIGADALETARAMAREALYPALRAAGLPDGAAVLLESADRAAGLALFADPRLALAVARGSGSAVTQLGAVARQTGTAVSLHGTGGAWLVADLGADAAKFAAAVETSLDRKVCNTLNVCCVAKKRAGELAPLFAQAVWRAGETLGHGARIHVRRQDARWFPGEWLARPGPGGVDAFVVPHDEVDLGMEWEWDTAPEVWFAVAEDLDAAIRLFNQASPRFIASLISEDADAQRRFYALIDAPFVGDGFTRWVDGQYALGKPELGLSNWQGGRPLARGGVLSGDGVFTIRARMRQTDPGLRR